MPPHLLPQSTSQPLDFLMLLLCNTLLVPLYFSTSVRLTGCVSSYLTQPYMNLCGYLCVCITGDGIYGPLHDSLVLCR